MYRVKPRDQTSNIGMLIYKLVLFLIHIYLILTNWQHFELEIVEPYINGTSNQLVEEQKEAFRGTVSHYIVYRLNQQRQPKRGSN